MGMKIVLSIFLILFPFVQSKTITKYVSSCDGIERLIIGERYIGTNIRGTILCRFAPKDSSYTLAVHFSKLSIPKRGGSCPVLKLIGYTSLMKQPELDNDGRIMPGRAIAVPSDPENIITVSCQNYTKMVGGLEKAKKVGQKIQMVFDSGSSTLQVNPFDIVMFSYRTGTGMQCPENHFRCWSDRYMCIDQSLECDGEQNCRDNSDEDSFKCTGRIGPLPLGMFIVLIAICFLLIIGVIIGIIFYRRRQARKKAERRQQRSIVMTTKDQQPFLSDPTQPRQYFAAPPESSIAS